MRLLKSQVLSVLIATFLLAFLTACGKNGRSTPTPTPTTNGSMGVITPTPEASRCSGLTGFLEIQILVGPAEAAEMEPIAVGNVPFTVTALEPYIVEGAGPITYEGTAGQVWGTYSVSMAMDTAVTGSCTGQKGAEILDLILEMAGEQLVVVEAEGFYGEYPWSGSQTRELSFPLEDGATAQGEGWAVVLNLGNQ